MSGESSSEAVTSYDVRAELESLLERDLLGPWDGPEEELPPGTLPAERYLLGRLVPKNRPAVPAREDPDLVDDPDLYDRGNTATQEDVDDEPEPADTARSGSMAAASLGLSFRVPADVDKLAVTASWGRYAPTKSEVHTTEQGRPRSVWKRSPAGGAVEIDLTEGEHEPIPVDPDHERVLLRVLVRVRGGCRIVDLALVNDQVQPPTGIDTARLYQARLQVTALDGAQSVFVGHNDPELGNRRRPATTNSPTWRCCSGTGGSTRTAGSARWTPRSATMSAERGG